ncbi:MAG TPA: hypothetical protein VIY52_31580 [Streptosporangiaceae bacterium]
MKNPITPNIALAIVLFAAVAAVALRAASRRPKPRWVAGTQTPAFTVTADERPIGCQTSAVEQMQHTFHELHASGRHAVCEVCDSQYS